MNVKNDGINRYEKVLTSWTGSFKIHAMKRYKAQNFDLSHPQK